MHWDLLGILDSYYFILHLTDVLFQWRAWLFAYESKGAFFQKIFLAIDSSAPLIQDTFPLLTLLWKISQVKLYEIRFLSLFHLKTITPFLSRILFSQDVLFVVSNKKIRDQSISKTIYEATLLQVYGIWAFDSSVN